ncbi:MAG TPA: alcohol dehydrogenase catalytic domain-containing protein [Blastocatellia bacterium]|nr:alcohol dehydrogenase catalytic domain-containing protein [Blastocatellia bacterium]
MSTQIANQTMRGCVLRDVRRLEVRDVPAPAPGPHEVLVRVQAVGLCGTDLHIYRGEANYNTDSRGQPIPLSAHPQILGHEITGIVEQVGTGVSDLREGDRVAIDQGINCLSRHRTPLCEYCATKDSHQCEFYTEHGITGLQGGLAQFIAIPAVNTVTVRSSLEPAQVALTEPLACIVHAMNAVERAAGTRYSLFAARPEQRVKTALIIGAGPAGLLFAQYLRRVIRFDGLLLASEPNELKRGLASRFGAEVIDPTVEDIIERLRDRTGGSMAELIVEASGAGEVFSLLPGLLRKQSTVLLYGHGHGGVDLSVLNGLQFKEPVLVSPVGGSGGFDADARPAVYRQALDLLESGVIEVEPFISHRYRSLDDVQRAFEEDFHDASYTKGIVQLDGEGRA